MVSSFEPGESYLFEHIELEAVAELFAPVVRDSDGFEYYLAERQHAVVFVNADVVFDGRCSPRDFPDVRTLDFGYPELAIVILGDLRVSGHFDLDPHTPCFVTGRLEAGSITNRCGNLVVGGALDTGLLFVEQAQEGGFVHAASLRTPLFIDAGWASDAIPGDYLLLATGTSPRHAYTLTRALRELDGELTETDPGLALRSLAEEGKGIDQLESLVMRFYEIRPDNVPEDAVWHDDITRYTLRQTDDDGNNHGVVGEWEADGTARKLRRFHHGTPHGEWLVEHNGRLYPQDFEHGVRRRPDSVPEDAIWLDDEGEWEHSETDDAGRKHGTVRWWRPDGTLACDSEYRHGVAHGRGHRYHESGEVSQAYTWVDGEFHGERWWYATREETTEYKYHPNIAKAVQEYDMGTPLPGRFYNWSGREVDDKGKPI